MMHVGASVDRTRRCVRACASVNAKVSIEAIRALRARVERTIPECRAALEATGGDVDAAVDRLQTPMERIRDRLAAMYEPLGHATLTARPAPERPTRADERDAKGMIEDWERALQARGVWTGPPDPSSLERLRAAYAQRFGRALPAVLDAFLSRWNGVELNPSTLLWGTPDVGNREMLGIVDEPEGAFPIGELLDSGYLFLLRDEVWFYDYSDPPPIFRVAPSFESFLCQALLADLDVLAVVERARDLARKG